MQTFTHYAMPMYSHDHTVYIRQMYEWHMKMSHYQDQCKLHHLERAKYFQGLMGATVHQIPPRPEEVA